MIFLRSRKYWSQVLYIKPFCFAYWTGYFITVVLISQFSAALSAHHHMTALSIYHRWLSIIANLALLLWKISFSLFLLSLFFDSLVIFWMDYFFNTLFWLFVYIAIFFILNLFFFTRSFLFIYFAMIWEIKPFLLQFT